MDLLEPFFDAIVQGEEYAVLNILRLAGDTTPVYTDRSNSADRRNSGGKGVFELKIKEDTCELIKLNDHDGRSALHWAACNSQSEKLTPMLIEKGAPFDISDSKGSIIIIIILPNHIYS